MGICLSRRVLKAVPTTSYANIDGSFFRLFTLYLYTTVFHLQNRQLLTANT